MNNVVRLEYAYGVCPKCKSRNYLRYLIHKDGLIHKPYEIKCINCDSYFKKEDIFGNGEETTPKPQTNYHLLISKTPKELAKWIAYETSCETCPVLRATDFECQKTNCKTAWEKWLEALAKEGE